MPLYARSLTTRKEITGSVVVGALVGAKRKPVFDLVDDAIDEMTTARWLPTLPLASTMGKMHDTLLRRMVRTRT